MTVEERQLLGAMSRIIRRIQIDRDPLGLALQAPAMPLDHRVGQRDPHPVQIRPIHRVLKARERRLRSQLLALDRVATTQQLLDRIAPQPARIIAIRVTAGDRIQPLAHQFPDRVADLARLTPVIDAPINASVSPSRRSHACSRIAPPSELACSWSNFATTGLAAQIRKQNTLSCAIVIMQRPLECGKVLW